MSSLVLVRHGRSEWNDKGLWTGFADPKLTDEGREEARRAAEALHDFRFDYAFTSLLSRAEETLEIILTSLGQKVPTKKDFALNERNYGAYTGKNKWQIKEEVGEETFLKIRRSWDYPIPEGESLKMVYARVIPYYKREILPLLEMQKNVLIAASGNSLRSLIKFLENIPDEKISEVEIGTGEAWVYELDKNGQVLSKEILAKNPKKV